MPARFLLVAPAKLNLGRDLEAGCTKSSNQFEKTEALGRFWGGFGRLWGALGSFWSLKINLGATFGRLWETLGDSGGAFGKALGGFGELWETLGESLGILWEALGKLCEALGIPATRRRTTKTTIYKNVGGTQTPDKPALLAHVNIVI